jgi:anti-sigma factor RsiW
MGPHQPSEHFNDEALLAFLDGELSRARTYSIRNHLKCCWKCRCVLADLESQAQMISSLLSVELDSDNHRSIRAKGKFLRWRDSFEERQRSFFGKRRSFLPGNRIRVALAG